jgi:hypothetical protein
LPPIKTSPVEGIKAADEPQAGRLPATRRPKESHELAFGNLETNFLQGHKGAKSLAYVTELHHRRHP